MAKNRRPGPPLRRLPALEFFPADIFPRHRNCAFLYLILDEMPRKRIFLGQNAKIECRIQGFFTLCVLFFPSRGCRIVHINEI